MYMVFLIHYCSSSALKLSTKVAKSTRTTFQLRAVGLLISYKLIASIIEKMTESPLRGVWVFRKELNQMVTSPIIRYRRTPRKVGSNL
jgi:hypothetical protein